MLVCHVMDRVEIYDDYEVFEHLYCTGPGENYHNMLSE